MAVGMGEAALMPGGAEGCWACWSSASQTLFQCWLMTASLHPGWVLSVPQRVGVGDRGRRRCLLGLGAPGLLKDPQIGTFFTFVDGDIVLGLLSPFFSFIAAPVKRGTC